MKRTIWILALSGIIATAAAHAAMSSSLGLVPAMLTTTSPHLVLRNTQDPTEISMAVPDTIGGSSTQRLSKDITYRNGCTLDKNGTPSLEKATVAYPRVSATVTRVSSEELLVEWKTRELEKMSTYTMDACTVEAPMWNVKEHSRRVSMNEAALQVDGWTLELTTQPWSMGARP